MSPLTRTNPMSVSQLSLTRPGSTQAPSLGLAAPILHVDPEAVGNTNRFVLSEMSGRSTVALKADEMGIELSDEEVSYVVDRLKELEHAGYHFEVADGSLELLMRTATGWKQSFYRLESNRVVTDLREDGTFLTEARIKLFVGDERIRRWPKATGRSMP